MQISIETKAKDGHIIVSVFNSNGARILKVTDNGNGQCDLTPNVQYRLEYQVWGYQSAEYEIHAQVKPANIGFPNYDLTRKYDDPHQDMGGFYFSLPLNL